MSVRAASGSAGLRRAGRRQSRVYFVVGKNPCRLELFAVIAPWSLLYTRYVRYDRQESVSGSFLPTPLRPAPWGLLYTRYPTANKTGRR
jgi:hypothetical protein